MWTIIMRPEIKFLVTSILLQLTNASANTCYLKGGQQTSSQDGYTPCFPSDAQTHCCAPDWTCLSNGLCLVKWDTSINTGACTDSTWRDSSCFQSCSEFSTLYRCDNNDWCCSAGGNTTNCCNDPGVATFALSGLAEIQNGTAFVPGYGLATTSQSASANASAMTNSATTSLKSATNSAEPTTTSLSKAGPCATTVGLGAGLGVGIPLLLAVGALSYFLFREQRNNKALRRQLGIGAYIPAPLNQFHDSGSRNDHQEKSGDSTSNRMHQKNSVSELPYESRHVFASELQS